MLFSDVLVIFVALRMLTVQDDERLSGNKGTIKNILFGYHSPAKQKEAEFSSLSLFMSLKCDLTTRGF